MIGCAREQPEILLRGATYLAMLVVGDGRGDISAGVAVGVVEAVEVGGKVVGVASVMDSAIG
ncbi:MAG: hypothetical protein ABI068_09470 [Ktedonobacterales bacterium]